MRHGTHNLNSETCARLKRSARFAYPKECAGLIVKKSDGKLAIRTCPKNYTTRDGFQLPLSLFWSTRKFGEQIIGIYHSHPNGSEALSHTDFMSMLGNGEPLWPNVDWYIIPITETTISALVRYTWHAEQKRFIRMRF